MSTCTCLISGHLLIWLPPFPVSIWGYVVSESYYNHFLFAKMQTSKYIQKRKRKKKADLPTHYFFSPSLETNLFFLGLNVLHNKLSRWMCTLRIAPWRLNLTFIQLNLWRHNYTFETDMGRKFRTYRKLKTGVSMEKLILQFVIVKHLTRLAL